MLMAFLQRIINGGEDRVEYGLGRDALDLVVEWKGQRHAIDVAGEDHVGIGSDTSVVPVDRTAEFENDNRAVVADLVAQGIFENGRPASTCSFPT